MWEPFFQGLWLVLQWPAFGFMLLGIILGVWLGAVPGLGGILGLVILLPFTFGMDPVPAFALLLGMFAVTTTSDTIASVLLGIPGTAASQATILDGYPLAQKGEARRAFGAAYAVSAFGGVFGALVLAVSLPVILPIILAFGSPELFMLAILGLSMIGSLSGNSIYKGLTVALAGLLIATIGYAETVAVPRFHFDSDYLLDGVPLIPVVLGLFAIPELLELATRDVSISRVKKEMTKDITIWTGVKDAWTHRWLVVRCSLLGTYVGMLPGLGAAIVDWFAYGHAVQSAKDKSQFGAGDIRGVIAPEAANNATKGGSLIPTVAFGIPGSLSTAILLGALLIVGLKPGPDMLTDNLHITFSMVWTIVIANVIAALLLMGLTSQIAKLAFISGHLIVPGVLVFVLMGAWLGGGSIGDWVTCLSMGLIGYVMKRGGWPRPPLILAIILGSLMENWFQRSLSVYEGFGWLQRPIVIVIAIIIVVTLFMSFRGILKAQSSGNGPEAGEGSERNPYLSLPLSLALSGIFIWAYFEAQKWQVDVNRFPIAIAIPGALLALAVLFRDVKESIGFTKTSNGITGGLRIAAERALLGKSAEFLGYLLGVLLLAMVAGQVIALLAFVLLYLLRWGGYSWKISLLYTAGVWIALFGFYDKTMNILWHPSLLDGFYDQVLEGLSKLTTGS